MTKKYLSPVSVLLFLSLAIGLAYAGKSILLPLVFAFFFWFVIVSWRDYLARVSGLGPLLPMFVQNIIAFASLVVVIIFVSGVIGSELQTMSESYPVYQANINAYIDYGLDVLGITFPDSTSVEADFDPTVLIQTAAVLFTNGLSSILFVFAYLVFIFPEQRYFKDRLRHSAGDSSEQAEKTVTEIGRMIKAYVGVKTFASATTGVLSGLVLLLFGVDFPFLWGFLAFMLNYIPNVGSIIGVLLPTLFSAIQFGSFSEPFFILLILTLVQFSIGNIVEPKLVGNRLNVSPLVIIFGLFFWGALWGIPGMFLSVPLTVTIMIVLSKFEETKKIAIWLSKDGII